MGTHPIFESDFDCLTAKSKLAKMVTAYDVYFKEMKKVMINNIDEKEIARICQTMWKGLNEAQKGVYESKAKLIKPEQDTEKPTTRSSKRLRDRKRKSPTPEKSAESSVSESDQLSETLKPQTLDPEIFDSEDRLSESEDRLSDKVESSDESSKGFSIAFGKIDEEKMNQKENYVAKPKAINLKQ